MPAVSHEVKRPHRIEAMQLRSGAARLGHHDAHEVGGVLGAEFFHDARAMHLDGARRDAEFAPGLLVRRAGGDLARARRARARSAGRGRGTPWTARRRPRPCCARRAHASVASRTRVTTVVASNGFSKKSNAPFLIASTAIGMSPIPEMMKIGAGYCWALSSLRMSRPDCPGMCTSRITQIGVRDLAAARNEAPSREAGDLIAGARQHDRQRVEHQGIVIDDEYLSVGHTIHGHVLPALACNPVSTAPAPPLPSSATDIAQTSSRGTPRYGNSRATRIGMAAVGLNCVVPTVIATQSIARGANGSREPPATSASSARRRLCASHLRVARHCARSRAA